MSFRDQAEKLLGNATRLLGEPVAYGPADSSISVQGIFSVEDRRIDDGGLPVIVPAPNLGVRLSDLPAKPVKGDRVVVRGTAYKVTEVREDGQGAATLYLNKTT